MQSESFRVAGVQRLIELDSTATSYIEKLEKRRMALLILITALMAHLGAKVVGGSAVPVISYMTPGSFDFF